MCLSLNFDSISANSILINDSAEEVLTPSLEKEQVTKNDATPWRIWQNIGPIDYEGETKFTTVYYESLDGSITCYSGYLGGRSIGGTTFIYEGYLYRCGDPRPIPAKIEDTE